MDYNKRKVDDEFGIWNTLHQCFIDLEHFNVSEKQIMEYTVKNPIPEDDLQIVFIPFRLLIH